MDEEIKNRLDKQDSILENIFKSTEKTRKYFLATLIISLVTFVIPLIALFFIVPWFMSTYMSSLDGLI